MSKIAPSAVERFESKLRDSPTGCVLWVGAKSVRGYGRFWDGGRMVAAHRFAWEVRAGPVPLGLSVLHRCDVPACCCFAHLFTGDQSDNMTDCAAKGRIFSGGRPRTEARCRRGHDFTPENTITEGTQRKCRACRNDLLRRSRALARLEKVSK
jgi:hypothetical protein